MSLLVVPLLPIAMYFNDVDLTRILISTAWFLGQSVVTAIAAGTTGIRFVQNVLAVHAGKKVTGARSTTTKTS